MNSVWEKCFWLKNMFSPVFCDIFSVKSHILRFLLKIVNFFRFWPFLGPKIFWGGNYFFMQKFVVIESTYAQFQATLTKNGHFMDFQSSNWTPNLSPRKPLMPPLWPNYQYTHLYGISRKCWLWTFCAKSNTILES